MVIPEVNPEHFAVIEDQKKRLGTTRGFIAVKPNCSIQSYAPCLAAWKEFGPKELVVYNLPGNFRCRKDLLKTGRKW